MTPAELAHHDIFAVVVCFADMDRVVSSLSIVARVFLIGGRVGGFFIGGGRGG